MIETINGAPIPLREKQEIFQYLAGQYGNPFVTLADEALRALVTKPGEFFYVKNCWPDYDEGDVDIDGMSLYPDLGKALDGIQLFLPEEECTADSVYWFLSEKWILNEQGQYVCPYTYTVANGEGSIRKRPDGRWEGRYTAGRDPETGSPGQDSEVKAKLKQAIQKNTEIDTLKAAQYTVGQWTDIWFENYAKIKVRPGSVVSRIFRKLVCRLCAE